MALSSSTNASTSLEYFSGSESASTAVISVMKRLREKLESISHLRVLAVDGSWNDGCIMTILMSRPSPLIHILRETAEVEKANFWLDGPKRSDGYFPGWMSLEPRSGGLKGNRLVVRLRRNLI